jgi:hypothetical protein
MNECVPSNNGNKAAEVIGTKVVRDNIRQNEVNVNEMATFTSIGNGEYRTSNTPKTALTVNSSTNISLLTVHISLSTTHKPSTNADISGNRISGCSNRSETPTINPIIMSAKVYRINLSLVILFKPCTTLTLIKINQRYCRASNYYGNIQCIFGVFYLFRRRTVVHPGVIIFLPRFILLAKTISETTF